MIVIKLLCRSTLNYTKLMMLFLNWHTFMNIFLKYTFLKNTLVRSPKCHKKGKLIWIFSSSLINVTLSTHNIVTSLFFSFYILVYLFIYMCFFSVNLYKVTLTFKSIYMLDI